VVLRRSPEEEEHQDHQGAELFRARPVAPRLGGLDVFFLRARRRTAARPRSLGGNCFCRWICSCRNATVCLRRLISTSSMTVCSSPVPN